MPSFAHCIFFAFPTPFSKEIPHISKNNAEFCFCCSAWIFAIYLRSNKAGKSREQSLRVSFTLLWCILSGTSPFSENVFICAFLAHSNIWSQIFNRKNSSLGCEAHGQPRWPTVNLGPRRLHTNMRTVLRSWKQMIKSLFVHVVYVESGLVLSVCYYEFLQKFDKSIQWFCKPYKSACQGIYRMITLSNGDRMS